MKQVHERAYPIFFIARYSVIILMLALPSRVAFGYELKVIPQVNVRTTFNDNIFYDEDKVDMTSDFATVLSPAIRLTDRTETFETSFMSRLVRTEYYDEKDLNATDQYHDGRMRWHYTEKIVISAEAGYSEDSQIDRDIETTGLVLGTPTRKRSHYGGDLDLVLTETSKANASYAYDRERFDDPEFDDSTSQDAAITLNHDLGPLFRETIGIIRASYAQYKYPYEDISNFSLVAGANRKLTEDLEVSAFLGRHMTRTSYDYSAFIRSRDWSRGTIGNVAVVYVGELTTSSLTFSSDIRSISGEAGTVRRTSLRYNLARQFSYELKGDLSAEYYLNRQNREQAPGSDLDKETFRIQPAVIYVFSKDFSLEASYRYTRLKDNEANKSKPQNLYYLGFAWQHPIPR
ncbi:MAG TPA: hypothetical protein PLS81_06000 [Deltaproteobacteria bacterium]|nr:hypothetical protein [Deltaproteobacteria bacterium]HPP81824.1 hypothetical protein [Deltaproteobacteria bacterium]